MMDRNTPPAITDIADLRIPEVKSSRLSNGTKLNVIADGTQPVVQLVMLWEGGYAEAPNPAIAQLVSDAVREGSATMSADTIEEIIDYNGAAWRTNTSTHFSSVSVNVMSDKLLAILPVILDMAYHPAFPADRIDRLRQRIIAARKVQLERVEVLAQEAATHYLAGENHYLTRNVEERDVVNATVEDLRCWHARTYTPSGLAVFLAGDVSDQLAADVAAMLENVPGTQQHPVKIVAPLAPTPTPSPHYIIKEGALQSAVNITIPTIGRQHPDYASLRLAIFALGGYFGSRLMSNIRERLGLTYGISSALCGYVEGGAMVITASTSPDNVPQLIDETINEVKNMIANPIGDNELQRIVSGFFTQLATVLDTPFGIADFVMSAYQNNAPDNYFAQQVQAVQRFTPRVAADMIERHIDISRAIITVAGPKC